MLHTRRTVSSSLPIRRPSAISGCRIRATESFIGRRSNINLPPPHRHIAVTDDQENEFGRFVWQVVASICGCSGGWPFFWFINGMHFLLVDVREFGVIDEKTFDRCHISCACERVIVCMLYRCECVWGCMCVCVCGCTIHEWMIFNEWVSLYDCACVWSCVGSRSRHLKEFAYAPLGHDVNRSNATSPESKQFEWFHFIGWIAFDVHKEF